MRRVHPLVAIVAMLVFFATPVAAQRAQEAAAQTPESVLLRFQIIHADGFTETDPAIADVSQVLRELFRFRGYRLAAESVVRVTAGAEFRQTTADSDGVEYVIEGNANMGGPGASSSVRLGVKLWRTIPGMNGGSAELIQTYLTVPVGQTVVVGSARTSPDVPTVILVVRPEAR